jgi:hypothetical protein
MRKSLITLMTFSLVATCSAFAQDEQEVSTDNQAGISADEQGTFTAEEPGTVDSQMGTTDSTQPGTMESTGGITTAEVPAPAEKKGIVDEKIGIRPQAGVVNYRDASNAKSNRALYGATLDFNLVNMSNMMEKHRNTGLYLGPSTGLLYSHIGAVGGTFFGDSGAQGGTQGVPNSNPGANMFLIPANLKAGWTVYGFRLSAHGGGNVIYRSAANSVLVGKNSPDTSNSKWGILPNAGADLEYGVLNGGAIVLRPDWTFGGSNSMFTGTIGLSVPIG